MLRKFQRAAHADPFAVDSLTVVQAARPTAPEATAVQGQSDAAKRDSVNQQGPKNGLTSGPTSTIVGEGATTFQTPDWATEPRPGTWYLEVMKDGAGIDQLPLDRKVTVFGRQAPLCHFVLDHPSVSRQHVALVYHKNGSFYVVDMGSAHGTFVSNERLRKDSPTEIEPGQSLKFAASTRVYMLRKNKLGNGGMKPPIRRSETPPVELPPPPDPADTEAVVAYHTIVNRHCYDSPLNAERPPEKGRSEAVFDEAHRNSEGMEDSRASKRPRLASRVSFSDQFGGALAQVVGVSDGVDVERVGPLGVPEGQALVGKYASLVETVIEPLPNKKAVSPREPPAVSERLKDYLAKSKGLYGDLPAPSTSEKASTSAKPRERLEDSKAAPTSRALPVSRGSEPASFEINEDIFDVGEDSSFGLQLRHRTDATQLTRRPPES